MHSTATRSPPVTAAAPDGPSHMLSLLCDFLGVCIHLILHARHVYPRDIFERRRHLDVTVFRSRHPELNEYITQVVEGARHLMERGEADALVISIHTTGSSSTTVLERFRFDIRLTTSARINEDMLRTQLRGFLLKLQVCDSLLAPLPSESGLSFTVELHSNETTASQPLPDPLLTGWVEADLQRELGSIPTSSGPCVVPLKSLTMDGFTLGLSVLTLSPSQG
jgi:mitotic spindle assembly checkpoint protein MAD2B